MKISKTKLKTIINEEMQRIEIEEGFMDFFRGKKAPEKPKNWKPEPEPEMVQMDMFPGQGYGKDPHSAVVASMAFDIIVSTMPKEKKAAELRKLIDKVKGDGALRSRIMQAVSFVGAEGGDESGSYDAQLGRAVALRENRKKRLNEGAWDAEIDREKNLKFIVWTASQKGLPPQTKIKDIPNVEWILQYHSKENDPATIYPLNSESSVSNAKELVNKEFPGYPWAK